MARQEIFPENYLALQFDCPMANFRLLSRGQPHWSNFSHCLLFSLELKVNGSLVQQGWVPKPSRAPGWVWTGILPILNVTPYPTGLFSLVFNVYGPLDYSPLVFNIYIVIFVVDLFWFAVFQSFASFFFVFCFSFLRFMPSGWLIFKWLYFSICASLSV